jgi:hypothetical protein
LNDVKGGLRAAIVYPIDAIVNPKLDPIDPSLVDRS